MISVPDRERAVELIDEACAAGARLAPACEVLGLAARTYQRWTVTGTVGVDARPLAERATPAHALSDAEIEQVVEACHRREHVNLAPAQIIARLLDEEGRYIASESSFYRILRRRGEQHHRGRAKPPSAPKPPTTHRADAPCQVWSWDVTWLPGPVRGAFFYLFLILDLYSRKAVGWEVYAAESAVHARTLLERTVLAQGCIGKPLILHADNGSPLKGATLLDKIHDLGIQPSHSRPRVSNDNAYSEALFRTCKYVPDYPAQGFSDLEAARAWVAGFVNWYNGEHRHSAIRYVTPNERHAGRDVELLAERRAIYQRARRANPRRWSGPIRNWNPIGSVWLNPQTGHQQQAPLDEAA